jgi:hypothetical protein
MMPQCSSKRYRETENRMMDAGLHINVEEFYLYKVLLFALSLVVMISIQTTNIFMAYDNIVKDLNINKAFTDAGSNTPTIDINTEIDMVTTIGRAVSERSEASGDFTNTRNSKKYIDYIETLIKNRWGELQQDSAAAARRIYVKLLRIRELETRYAVYLTSLAVSILMYFMPDIMMQLRLRLIEDKRDWEIMNYIYVFSIFGRMPPFNIKNVLNNTLAVSEIYKPLVLEALNGVKSGKGEEAFSSLLDRIKNQELFELFEAMRLSMNTGILNMVDNIDEMAENQLKWLEIKSIKRRKTKQVLAMLPVVIVMFLAAVYFSYSLSILSNPMNFIK